MSDGFVFEFLRAAQELTNTERGLAADRDLKTVGTVGISDAALEDENFNDVVTTWLSRAIDSGDTVITNNVITDDDDGPSTNTSFANLRVGFAMPISTMGAIYCDQLLRVGLIEREVIDRVKMVLDLLVKEQRFTATYDEIIALYQDVRAGKA